MFDKNDLGQVKKDIETCLGQKVILKSNISKNKIVEEEGKLAQTYPNVFVVEFEQTKRKATYSYTDVLIKSVEISVADSNNEYQNLFGNANTIMF